MENIIKTLKRGEKLPIIKDKYHKLVINLATDINITSPQTISLDVYKKNNLNEDTLVGTFTPTSTSDGYKFNVPFSDSRFTIGDNLSKFVVKLGGTYNLYDLHEGVAIVVDGVETSVKEVLNGTVQYDENDDPILIDTVRNPQFALAFNDNELHTVQAVYKGNKELGVAISNKLTLQAQQRDDGSTLVDGKYILEIVRMPDTLKYMEQPNWQWRLTKGGVGIGGKTVELVYPTGNSPFNTIYSGTTDSNGYVGVETRPAHQLRWWIVGEYKVGAKFYHYDEVEDEDKILTEVWKTVKIVKNDPKITFRASGAKGKNARFTLKDPQGEGMANKKVTIKVGSKKYIKTTNSNGHVYLMINNKGHFKYKVIYMGDDNLNAIARTFEETIT